MDEPDSLKRFHRGTRVIRRIRTTSRGLRVLRSFFSPQFVHWKTWWMILLMVGRNPANSPVEVGSDHPIIHRVLAPSQVVVWDFWTINSMIKKTHQPVNQVLPSDLFGSFKWPFQGLSDLHLGNPKGHLEEAGSGLSYFVHQHLIEVLWSNPSSGTYFLQFLYLGVATVWCERKKFQTYSPKWWVLMVVSPMEQRKKVTKRTHIQNNPKMRLSVAGMSLLLIKKAGKKRSSSTHTKHHKTVEVKHQ